MKVAFITMHRGSNYGSALQTYTLSEILRNITSSDPVVIDYIPERINRSKLIKKCIIIFKEKPHLYIKILIMILERDLSLK